MPTNAEHSGGKMKDEVRVDLVGDHELIVYRGAAAGTFVVRLRDMKPVEGHYGRWELIWHAELLRFARELLEFAQQPTEQKGDE